MAATANLARATSATVGTGTITLGAAVSGYLTWVLCGIPAGVVGYGIKDGSSSEVGRGVYDGNVTISSRTPLASTNANAAISLSGSAEIYLVLLAEDISVLSLLAHRAFGGI